MDDETLTNLICAELGRLPGWEWGEHDDAYPTDSVGIFYGSIGTEPDRAVGVRIYGSTDDMQHLSWRRIQLRIRGERGNPAGADDLAHFAYLLMCSLNRQHGISEVTRNSMAPAGSDQNRREERTENYLIILDN